MLSEACISARREAVSRLFMLLLAIGGWISARMCVTTSQMIDEKSLAVDHSDA
jgi:hypothetical protein